MSSLAESKALDELNSLVAKLQQKNGTRTRWKLISRLGGEKRNSSEGAKRPVFVTCALSEYAAAKPFNDLLQLVEALPVLRKDKYIKV